MESAKNMSVRDIHSQWVNRHSPLTNAPVEYDLDACELIELIEPFEGSIHILTLFNMPDGALVSSSMVLINANLWWMTVNKDLLIDDLAFMCDTSTPHRLYAAVIDPGRELFIFPGLEWGEWD
jgi:hypothetical protein